jgi:hypothetical protein
MRNRTVSEQNVPVGIKGKKAPPFPGYSPSPLRRPPTCCALTVSATRAGTGPAGSKIVFHDSFLLPDLFCQLHPFKGERYLACKCGEDPFLLVGDDAVGIGGFDSQYPKHTG